MDKNLEHIAQTYKQDTQDASPMHSKGFSSIAEHLLKDSLNIGVSFYKDDKLMSKISYLNNLEGIPSNIMTMVSDIADFTFRKEAASINAKPNRGGSYA
ncbi:MAG TPA: hypothetical protein PK762_14080 [Candidatus Kapabacteria bacterium]|nr:hypothetical protein [Candidatus Kapabacteria bacterium]